MNRSLSSQKHTDLMGSDSTNSPGDDDSSNQQSFSESQQTDSSPSGSGNSSSQYDGDNVDHYVEKRKKGLGIAKVAVLMFLFCLAGVTSWAWWRSAALYEEDLYTEEFDKLSEKVVQAFLDSVEIRAVAASSLAVTFSTQAVGSGLTWPFVSYSNFERRIASTNYLVGATSIWFSPFLTSQQRTQWEEYVVQNQDFLESNFTDPFFDTTSSDYFPYRLGSLPIEQGLYRFEEGTAVVQEEVNQEGYVHAPIWQSAPSRVTSPSQSGIELFDQQSEKLRRDALEQLRRLKSSVFTTTQAESTPDSLVGSDGYNDGPHVSIYTPIFDDLILENPEIVGSLTLDIPWQSFWDNIGSGIKAPLSIVLQSSCNEEYSFEIGEDEDETKYIGQGVPAFSNKLGLSRETSVEEFADILDLDLDGESVCLYALKVTPTKTFEDLFLTNRPWFSAIGLGAIVVVTMAVFVCYDHVIQVRQLKVIEAAKRSNAIIKSLFPAGFRNRLLEDPQKSKKAHHRFEKLLPENYSLMETQKQRLQNYLAPSLAPTSGKSRKGGGGIIGSEPIAEFFPATSIMFADLSGFTAWSSTREPAQVFTLLETLYGAMDKAAKRLGVFKVETVGDCYVAATGIPDPREDHAILMAKFANTCIAQIRDLTGALESQLGPGTGDLAFRIGISSGPVTAGVLRGEKSRFQLFGDTMNTASRMESTGQVGRIHVSEETANLLIDGGKEDWIDQQANKVMATGKGEIVTYWLKTNFGKVRKSSFLANIGPQEQRGSFSGNEDMLARISAASTSSQEAEERIRRRSKMLWGSGAEANSKIDRLVEYNTEVLISLLKKIVARRSAVQDTTDVGQSTGGKIALDEVKEVIIMPRYNQEASVKMASDYTVDIPDAVRSEMRAYVKRIAAFYHLNPFHNFEHASHVALSANKLLKRIVMPEEVNYRRSDKEKVIEKVLAVAEELHQHTLGISSDPVAQFAVVFSALIHDVDHPGVPNGRLAVEEPDVAEKYRNKSIAEQRSIDIAWGVLMEDGFDNLRKCMFPTAQELRHFRQLIVNCVMATDIFDKELGALRKARWQKCFHPEEVPALLPDLEDAFNRKATIVIEHIIQASDVAHTMQHWHVYIKWNERLFREMMTAYKEGRSDKDPVDGWYNGEIWFFDNYVIPLAHKLKECGVFGVSSAEYLQYATENRDEWERKGREVCKRMKEDFDALDDDM